MPSPLIPRRRPHAVALWLAVEPGLVSTLLLLLLGLTLLCLWPAPAWPQPRIYAPDGTYLGRLSANDQAWDSTSNPIGPYGNPNSSLSINNPISRYGSDISAWSPNNPQAGASPAPPPAVRGVPPASRPWPGWPGPPRY